MKRVIIPIAIALIIILSCVVYLSCDANINSGDGEEDILYNDIVYQRSDFPNYNLKISEENAKYIGDFYETYGYGQQLPWEVYSLNGDGNVFYSAHAVWVRPGYSFPEEFGEEFSSVDYAITDGIDFLVMEDSYTEQIVPLATFTKSVKLEDIVESEPSDVTEFKEHDSIRFMYKSHANMRLYYKLCSAEGKYYLNILQGEDGTTALFEIKPEYVDLLTSAIPEAQ